ncbi:Rv3235 family protein [Mycobacterium sp.]|uniref:Rv3235 family protein n=1 Tax=Mycobacterium sp. TaxID=1785 RepID=UPI003C70B0D3
MTSSPAVSPAGRDAFAVLPVVDYEPPTHDAPQNVLPCRQSSHAPLRRHSAQVLRRPYAGQAGSRPPATPTPRAGNVMSAQMRQAATFADAALRRVLEVIDRRRPAAQLRPMLAPSLVDSVVSVGRPATGHASGHPPADNGAAVLRRMRLQPAGHRDPETAAEVFGCYSRGDRIHAIACRVEQVRTGGGTRWLVVALHIG